MTMRNLYTAIETNAKRYPDKTAIVYQGSSTSYANIQKRINNAAAEFCRRGLEKGDRIAFMMHNCPEYIVCFYAAMKLGLIAVSLNTMFKREEAEFILNDAGVRLLIVHNEYLTAVIEIPRIKEKRMELIIISSENVDSSFIASPYSPAVNAKTNISMLTVLPGDPAVIAYTSGTTGFPKGVVHSHQNILSHLTGVTNHLQFTSRDIFLASLPFFQFVAFLIHAGLSILVGGKLVIMKKFDTAVFLANIQKERVTFFAGVPTIYQMIVAAGEKQDINLGSVRFGICAGSPLAPELRKQFERAFNFRIVHCYGMTEIAMIATCEDPYQPATNISVGKPLPHIRVRITGEDGCPLKPSQTGEIEIGVECAFLYYWNNLVEMKKSIKNGWYLTGDLGRFDDDGNLYIVDRKKDVIIRGGFNIYPLEIERILLRDPRISEAAVIGIPHPRLGEVPMAFIALKEGEMATEEMIISLTKNQLAKFKVLEKVKFVARDFFPRNALGKIMKKNLKLHPL